MLWVRTVHVIYGNDTLEGGNIPDQQITDSIYVLNNDFAPTGLNFTLINITRTLNPVWFDSFVPDSWVLAISSLATPAHPFIA